MPMGAWGSSNSPSAPVLAVRMKSESAARSVTSAPEMGRCWASCTTPRTVANTVAKAGREVAAIKAAARAQIERIKQDQRINKGDLRERRDPNDPTEVWPA